MLRVLISIAIALPLYELLRYRILRGVRESQRRKARTYAEEHGVRVDLFKFGGKQLVREELLNDRAILRAMEAAADAGERPTEVRQRVEEYIDEIVPAFSLAAYFQLGMRLARAAIGAVYRPVILRPPPPLARAQSGPPRRADPAHRRVGAVLRSGGHQLRPRPRGRSAAFRAARSGASADARRKGGGRAAAPVDRSLARRRERRPCRRGKAAAARVRRARVRGSHPVPRPAPIARGVAADGRAAACESEGRRRR